LKYFPVWRLLHVCSQQRSNGGDGQCRRTAVWRARGNMDSSKT